MDVERLEPGHRVEMYVSPSCPYCQQARDHVDARGYPYTVYDAQNDRAQREQMFAYTGNDQTVPAIVIDGTYVQSGWAHLPVVERSTSVPVGTRSDGTGAGGA